MTPKHYWLLSTGVDGCAKISLDRENICEGGRDYGGWSGRRQLVLLLTVPFGFLPGTPLTRAINKANKQLPNLIIRKV